jgi:hypothetical protein
MVAQIDQGFVAEEISRHQLPTFDVLPGKGTFGARRVKRARSEACLVPDVSNRRFKGTAG